MTILQTLRKQPRTIYQGIELHGTFTKKVVDLDKEFEKVLELYCELVDRGCLVKEGLMYRVTVPCLTKLKKMDLKIRPDLGEVAQRIPREKNAWSPPLSARYFLPKVPQR